MREGNLILDETAGRTQYFEWGSVEWLYEPEDSASGHPTAAIVTFAVGKTQPAHVHAGFEQFLYILGGVGTQWSAGVPKAVRPGVLIHNPPYVEHAFANSGDVPLRVLTIYLPVPFPLILGETDLRVEETTEEDLDMQELPDVQALQHLQDHVAQAMNMAAITVDSRGKPITRGSGTSEFCRLVRSSPEGLARCLQSGLQAGVRAARLQKPLVFDCYLGLTNVVAPILVKDESIGSVICGQVLLKEPADADMENIANTGLPAEPLESAFRQLPVISKSRIYTAAELLSSISYQLVEIEQRYHSQRRLAQELKTKADMTELLRQTELQALQSQINPHFLFNTLNAIANLALLENAPQTREMVYTLSELMRYALRSASHMVTIREEIAHVKNYLLIQRTRFHDRLESSVQVDPEIMRVPLPPLTLQPLVENAVVHAFKEHKSGQITLIARRQDSRCVIQIHDNGMGMTEEKVQKILLDSEHPSAGIGIRNVRRRLQHHFGKESSFEITSTWGEGTTVCLKVPFGKEPANDREPVPSNTKDHPGG